MGFNCRITLPPQARLRDVADVIGALAGLPVTKRDLYTGVYACRVEGVKVSSYVSSGLEGCAKIEFTAPLTGLDYCVMYHFEWGADGSRGLMPQSTRFWIAVGVGLVEFFGGSVDFSDADEIDTDLSIPTRPDIHAEDGAEWTAFQDRKLAVQPLTRSELKKRQKAAGCAL